MAWFKSAFARVHFALAIALTSTIALGLALALLVPHYGTIATIHFLAGLSIIVVPALVLWRTKNRRMVLRAFVNRLRLTKKDFTAGKPLALAAKLSANLLALSVLLQLLTGIGMRTGLLVTWFPGVLWYSFHHLFLYIIPSLIVIHAVMMKASKAVGAKKTVKVASREPTTSVESSS